MKVRIVSKSGSPRISKKLIRLVGEKTMRHLGWDQAEVSIVLGDDSLIQDLNVRYRGRDHPTDVLAFCLDLPQLSRGRNSPPRVLGEIVISVEAAHRQSKKEGHSIDQEVAMLLIHGILHLAGFDHEGKSASRRMRREEQELRRVCSIG